MSGPVAGADRTMQAGFIVAGGMTLVEYATPEETVAAVRNGEAVAVLADNDYLAPIAAESGGELVMLEKTEAIGGGVGLGFRDSDDDLRAKFDAAIKSMKCDGTLEAMIIKPEYFGPETNSSGVIAPRKAADLTWAGAITAPARHSPSFRRKLVPEHEFSQKTRQPRAR
jgi:polar amino acid transport system substrate-binding protein